MDYSERVEPHVVDVDVVSHGSVYVFNLHSDRAQAWVADNVPEPTKWGLGIVVEHRYAGPLALGMISDGLVVE